MLQLEDYENWKEEKRKEDQGFCVCLTSFTAASQTYLKLMIKV